MSRIDWNKLKTKELGYHSYDRVSSLRVAEGDSPNWRIRADHAAGRRTPPVFAELFKKALHRTNGSHLYAPTLSVQRSFLVNGCLSPKQVKFLRYLAGETATYERE